MRASTYINNYMHTYPYVCTCIHTRLDTYMCFIYTF